MVNTDLCSGAAGDVSGGFWPWCCCETCCLWREEFNGSELSTDWTTSDTWTVTGGYASPTASSDAAIYGFEHSDANLVVDMLIYATDDTQFFLTFDHSGGSYKYLKVVTDAIAGQGHLIYGTSGGGDSIDLTAAIFNNTEYLVRYCYDGTTVIGNVFDTDGEPVASIAEDVTFTNVKVGMAVGTYSGTPQIRHFYGSDYGEANCTECVDPRGCTTCDGSFTPNQIRLNISGVTGGTCSAALCDAWNGTYIFDINNAANPCGSLELGIGVDWPVSVGGGGCAVPGDGWDVALSWHVNTGLPAPFGGVSSDYLLIRADAVSVGTAPTSFCGDVVMLLASIFTESGGTFPCFREFDGKLINKYTVATAYQYEDSCTSGNAICTLPDNTFLVDALLEP